MPNHETFTLIRDYLKDRALEKLRDPKLKLFSDGTILQEHADMKKYGTMKLRVNGPLVVEDIDPADMRRVPVRIVGMLTVALHGSDTGDLQTEAELLVENLNDETLRRGFKSAAFSLVNEGEGGCFTDNADGTVTLAVNGVIIVCVSLPKIVDGKIVEGTPVLSIVSSQSAEQLAAKKRSARAKDRGHKLPGRARA